MKPRYAALIVLYCAGLFWLSSKSVPVDMGEWFPYQDKAVHAVLYAGLAGVVSLGLRRADRAYGPAVLFWVPVAFAFFYGLTDEIHQYFVPGRFCDVYDQAANSAGALAMQALLCGVVWRRPRPQRRDAA